MKISNGTSLRSAVSASVIVNALFLLFVLLCFHIKYNINDDYVMAAYANGVFGFSEFRLVYINVVTGFLLRLLYSAIPGVPWMGLIQYSMMFCGFTALCFVLLRRWKLLPGLCLSAALLLFFGLDAYCLMQYTKTTAILTLGGLLLMFQSHTEQAHVQKLMLCSGFALALFGFTLRSLQFFSCGLIACFIFFEFLPREKGWDFLRGTFLLLRPYLLLLLSSVVLIAVDSAAYAGDEWREYKEYNKARTEVMDFGGTPAYTAAAERFEEMGISEHFMGLISEWLFYDSEIVDAETFYELAQIRDEAAGKKSLAENISGYIRRSLLPMAKEWFSSGLLVVFFLWLLFGRHDKTALLAVFCSTATLILLTFMLYIQKRYHISWVNFSLLLSLTVLLLWFIPREGGKHGYKAAALALALAAFFTLRYFPYRSNLYTRDFSPERKLVGEFTEMLKAQDELILMDIYTYLYIYESPLSCEGYIVGENLIPFGGWQTAYPPFEEILAEHGVNNPYRDCVNNEDILLLTHRIEDILLHIQKEYCAEASAVCLYEPLESLGYGLYKIIG